MRHSVTISKHNHQIQPFFLRLAAIVVASFIASVHAQTSAESPFELEEVIVTAQKREQHLSEVPMSVSVGSFRLVGQDERSNPYEQFGLGTQSRPRVIGIRVARDFQ